MSVQVRLICDSEAVVPIKLVAIKLKAARLFGTSWIVSKLAVSIRPSVPIPSLDTPQRMRRLAASAVESVDLRVIGSEKECHWLSFLLSPGLTVCTALNIR